MLEIQVEKYGNVSGSMCQKTAWTDIIICQTKYGNQSMELYELLDYVIIVFGHCLGSTEKCKGNSVIHVPLLLHFVKDTFAGPSAIDCEL